MHCHREFTNVRFAFRKLWCSIPPILSHRRASWTIHTSNGFYGPQFDCKLKTVEIKLRFRRLRTRAHAFELIRLKSNWLIRIESIESALPFSVFCLVFSFSESDWPFFTRFVPRNESKWLYCPKIINFTKSGFTFTSLHPKPTILTDTSQFQLIELIHKIHYRHLCVPVGVRLRYPCAFTSAPHQLKWNMNVNNKMNRNDNYDRLIGIFHMNEFNFVPFVSATTLLALAQKIQWPS